MTSLLRARFRRKNSMTFSTIGRAHAMVATIALIGFGLACDTDHDEQPAKPIVESETIEPDWGGIASTIEKIRKDLDDVEGREGILAEQRLYSNFDEELIIRDFFQDRRNGFFLDVGCSYAVRGSNTYYLEKHLGWTGIGIDALEDYGAQWKKERPDSMFFAYLVTDRSGIRKTFFKSPGLALSSTNEELASGKIFGAKLDTVEVQIETITLNDLLDRAEVTKIDLLSMDIEGHEPKALAGFDIDRFQPELVVIERSISRAKNRMILRHFERHGYQLLERYVPFDPVNSYFARMER
jgi:FkbM family methyltransferase